MSNPGSPQTGQVQCLQSQMQWFARLLLAFIPQTAFTLIYSRSITKSRLILPHTENSVGGQEKQALGLSAGEMVFFRFLFVYLFVFVCFFPVIRCMYYFNSEMCKRENTYVLRDR